MQQWQKMGVASVIAFALSASAFAAKVAPNSVAAAPTMTANTSAMTQSTNNESQASSPVSSAATVSVSKTGVPLNQYGAVNVNAKIPLAQQVPAVPAGFVEPKMPILSTRFNQEVPAPPQLDAKSYVLLSANSGDVLAASNANKRMAPASLTKLMLLYITEKELAAGVIHLTDQVTVPQVAWATGGSRMFLKPGEKVTVRQLISGIIVDSGNDAAVTLATYVAGSQSSMVSLMNQTAKQLGMVNTHFNDVMGLPVPDHYSSARDMSVLAEHIVNDFPQYLSWYKQKWLTYDGITQPNFNKLLFIYQYAEGLKTGSTNEAGYSLVSAAKMPNRHIQLIGVVMGAPNANASAEASKALLTYGFRFFRSKPLYQADQVLTDAKVYGGKNSKLPVGVMRPLYVTYPAALADKALMPQLVMKSDIEAPIKQGQVVGHVVISVDQKVLTEAPVVALKNIARGNWWQRLMGHIDQDV